MDGTLYDLLQIQAELTTHEDCIFGDADVGHAVILKLEACAVSADGSERTDRNFEANITPMFDNSVRREFVLTRSFFKRYGFIPEEELKYLGDDESPLYRDGQGNFLPESYVSPLILTRRRLGSSYFYYELKNERFDKSSTKIMGEDGSCKSVMVNDEAVYRPVYGGMRVRVVQNRRIMDEQTGAYKRDGNGNEIYVQSKKFLAFVIEFRRLPC